VVLKIPKNIFRKKKIENVGEPPGTLIYTGKIRREKSKLRIINYTKDDFEIRDLDDLKVGPDILEKDKYNWINVTGLANVNLIENIGNLFDLHPLVMEDILNTLQRPKLEEFEKYIFIVLKNLVWNEERGEFDQEQISLILGENFVLSFQEEESDIFEPIFDRIKIPKGKVRTMESDYLLYALVDLIVDNYFIVMEYINEKIETIEDELISEPVVETLRKIYRIKRTVIDLRKFVWPLRELVNKLQREQTKLISASLQIYIRDVYDHIFRITETIDNFREIIFGMLDMYLSSVSNKMNDVMKVLTIISTVFIPLSFLTGFYGMNLPNMPELRYPYSYPIVIGVMILISIIMLLYFKRRKWI